MVLLNIKTKKDRVASQIKLRDAGFYSGPIDGLWGEKSEQAYKEYLESENLPIAMSPIGDIPWWRTRRGQGLLTMLLGFAGMFIPALSGVDTGQIVDIVWSNLDSVDVIIEKSGEIITAIGLIWSIIGAKNARAPIDNNLVAKIGGKEIRLPKRTYNSPDEVKSIVERAKGWFANS
jgi:hypothetical protein